MRPIPLGLARDPTLLRPRTGALRRSDPPPSLTQYKPQTPNSREGSSSKLEAPISVSHELGWWTVTRWPIKLRQMRFTTWALELCAWRISNPAMSQPIDDYLAQCRRLIEAVATQAPAV